MGHVLVSILGHFGDHLGPWGRHGDSKWLSKGAAREPREVLEPSEKAGWKIDDFGGPRGRVNFFFPLLGALLAEKRGSRRGLKSSRSAFLRWSCMLRR